MFSGSDDARERIRQAIDLVDLVSEQIQLRRQGQMFVGLCPWHNDSRPSLRVNPDRQTWKCWVCDLGGDVFSFVMQREGVDFRQALEMLAERSGIELSGPAPHSVTGTAGQPEDKPTLYRAMAWASEQYHELLLKSPQAEPAREYLRERGINGESIARFQLGFAPHEWHWLVQRAGAERISPQVLQAVGLTLQSERTGNWFDRFRGRVIFPICDTQRRPIAVGGRILPQWADEKTAKYINSPETRLFSKSDQLYGLHLARDVISRRREVLVMEGYTDVVIARQFGVEHAVAVLGTALGQRHIQLLRRFADRILLLLDGDVAGQRRASEILELFIANQVDLRIVTLPGNLDPCDFLLQHGQSALQQLIDQAPDAWDYKIQLELRGIDVLRDTHRANQALENLMSTFAKAPRMTAGSPGAAWIRQQQILNRLAREFRLDELQLRQRLEEQRRQTRPVMDDSDRLDSTKPRRITLEPVERDLFELLLQLPAAVGRVLELIQAEHLPSAAGREVLEMFATLHDRGELPDIRQLLMSTEDAAVKSLLVALDEQGRRKLQGNGELALNELLQTLLRRHVEAHLQRQQLELENDHLDEQQQVAMLLQILQTKQELIDHD